MFVMVFSTPDIDVHISCLFLCVSSVTELSIQDFQLPSKLLGLMTFQWFEVVAQ